MEQGGQGGGSPGEQRAGEGSILGRKAGAEIKTKHLKRYFHERENVGLFSG